MAGLDKSNYRKEQNSYYNINIYNDTNIPIAAQYSTALSMPLLHKPSECEIAVARAEIPLDGIPISQRNIGYEEWIVRFQNVNEDTFRTGFVGQFNPTILYDNKFNLALTNQPLQNVIIYDSAQTPGTSSSMNQSPSVNTIITNVTTQSSDIPNICFGLTYIVHNDLSLITRYLYNNDTAFDTVDISTIVGFSARIHGICVSSNNDIVYAVCKNIQTNEYFVVDVYNNPLVPCYLENYSNSFQIHGFECNDGFIYVSFVIIGGTLTTNITVLSPNPLGINETFDIGVQPRLVYVYTDNTTPDKFYTNASNLLGFTRNTMQEFTTDKTFLSPANHNFIGFLGSDQLDNILIDLLNTTTNHHSIYAYNKTTSDIVYYIITGEPNRLLRASKFIPSPSLIPGPSTTPYYEIYNYQTYLDQINLCIQTVFNSIKNTTGWPSQICPYISYSGSKFSLIIDKAFVSGGNAIISFNDRLWQRFMLNSSTNLTDDSFEDLQVLDLIPNQTISDLLQITQPFSTSYRWFDITRVIIGSSKLSIAGDCELSDTSLLSITDFSVDTSSDTVLLQIYNPIVIRFYQMFGTTPLTMLDVNFSYSTRDGRIYPIYITPGSACSVKLLFKRSPVQLSF